MKFSKSIKTFVLASLTGILMMACSTDTRHEANREFEEFSTWVDENSQRAETATEEEWNEMQAEYTRRSTELEKSSADWDDKSKAEWEEVQQRWNETVGKTEARFRATEVDLDTETEVNDNQ